MVLIKMASGFFKITCSSKNKMGDPARSPILVELRLKLGLTGWLFPAIYP